MTVESTRGQSNIPPGRRDDNDEDDNNYQRLGNRTLGVILAVLYHRRWLFMCSRLFKVARKCT